MGGREGPQRWTLHAQKSTSLPVIPASQLHAPGPERRGAPSWGQLSPLSPPRPTPFPWGFSHYCVLIISEPLLGSKGPPVQRLRNGQDGWSRGDLGRFRRVERRRPWAPPAVSWGRALTTKLLSFEAWLVHTFAHTLSKYLLPLCHAPAHGPGLCGPQSPGRAGMVHRSAQNRARQQERQTPRMEH